MPTRHERIMAQSGMDGTWRYILTGLGTWAAIAGTLFLIARGGVLELP